MTVLGLDIGGANLKAATAAGRAVSVPFALWKQPDALPAALAALVAEFPEIDEFAVTMTGELCDCFATKREGVNRILDAVEFAAAGRPVRVWSVLGKWLLTDRARQKVYDVAASNWNALAAFAGRYERDWGAILIDIGSTTTDIIPLDRGEPTPINPTDADRLTCGELVYVGVKRTPIMALGLPKLCAEYFADTRDVHIILGQMPEEPAASDTADGRPANYDNCLARLARMLGTDTEETESEHIVAFAEKCFLRQRALIAAAINEVGVHNVRTLIVSGTGEWLARIAWKSAFPKLRPRIVSLSAELGPDISACAPAYAVAVLASERTA